MKHAELELVLYLCVSRQSTVRVPSMASQLSYEQISFSCAVGNIRWVLKMIGSPQRQINAHVHNSGRISTKRSGLTYPLRTKRSQAKNDPDKYSGQVCTALASQKNRCTTVPASKPNHYSSLLDNRVLSSRSDDLYQAHSQSSIFIARSSL